MNPLRTGVLVFVLLMPVACAMNSFLAEPVVCYLLDGFLIIYCLVTTGLYFKEKFFVVPAEDAAVAAGNNRIYEELERPTDADPNQVLDPSRERVRTARKKKSQPRRAQEQDFQLSMVPNA